MLQCDHQLAGDRIRIPAGRGWAANGKQVGLWHDYSQIQTSGRHIALPDHGYCGNTLLSITASIRPGWHKLIAGFKIAGRRKTQ